MTPDTHRILIVASDRIGELVMAQSLFIELKNRDPACRIEVLARPELFPLLERMPQIANAIPLPADFDRFRMTDRLSFARQIRSGAYNHAILLNVGWRLALIPMLAWIPVRTGYSPKTLLNDIRTAEKPWLALEKMAALGLENSGEALPVDLALPNLEIGLHNQLPVIEKFAIVETVEPVLALCPGGGEHVGDRWGIECYACLAREALGRGWRIWLLGEKKDHSIGVRICETAGRCQNFIGRTKLSEAIDLLSLADVVVTHYSALMHIALALQRQVWIIADSARIESTACRQPGARILPLGATCGQVLSDLPGG